MILSELKIGEEARIIKINCPKSVKDKLRNMGIETGKKISVLRVALFGTSVEIKSENLRLAIGKKYADQITVKYV